MVVSCIKTAVFGSVFKRKTKIPEDDFQISQVVILANIHCFLSLEKIHCVKSVQIRSFFWSVFSRIRAEYGEILCISPYSVQMRENTDQNKLRIWTFFTQRSNNKIQLI